LCSNTLTLLACILHIIAICASTSRPVVLAPLYNPTCHFQLFSFESGLTFLSAWSWQYSVHFSSAEGWMCLIMNLTTPSACPGQNSYSFAPHLPSSCHNDQYQNISYSSCLMHIRKMIRWILQYKFQACINTWHWRWVCDVLYSLFRGVHVEKLIILHCLILVQ